MSILSRYVIRQVLQNFLVTLLVTTVLLAVVGVAKEGIKNGLPLGVLLRMFPYLVPDMMRFTAPGCMLLAVCMVYGRMSGSNEVMALKSLGLNPTVIVWPVLVFSLLLSVYTFVLYELHASWCGPGLARVVVESVEEIAYGALRAQRTFHTPRLEIVVKDVEGVRLIQPAVTMRRAGDGQTVHLTAQEAELRRDEEQNALVLSCRRGQVQIEGQGTLRFNDHFDQLVALDEHAADIHRASMLPMRKISAQIVENETRMAELQQQCLQKGADLHGLQASIDATRETLCGLRTEPHRRLADGFTCLCFALIGIPAAMLGRQTDTLATFFICFLPILLLYYPFHVLGEIMCKSGAAPPIAIWAANLVLGVIGFWLLEKVVRH